MYSVDDLKSFEHISERLADVEKNKSENGVIVIVANKIDIPTSLRQVSTDAGRALAESRGLAFYEVSAQTGENVDAMFQELVDRTLPYASPVPPPKPPPKPHLPSTCNIQ
eukprot:TRINITY_DN6015_c0_g1_i5.p1 TRINITY_DN6015_c0_g1~~TRINITY_DN6015_c0_g1_i5.p1  ORF type:complete len:110 (+),score=0.43 TRINITY_DN6015_c0_g1_i5:111-440(+)